MSGSQLLLATTLSPRDADCRPQCEGLTSSLETGHLGTVPALYPGEPSSGLILILGWSDWLDRL